MKHKKNILIIKPDHIGDYILFRNFLYEFKKSVQYSDYNITLVCHEKIKDLAEYLDSVIISKFIWIDLEKYLSGTWYSARVNQLISEEIYEEVINCSFLQLDQIDCMIALLNSNAKTMIKLSTFNLKDDHPYTKVIDFTSRKLFIFETLKLSFSEFFSHPISLIKPKILLEPNDIKNNIMIKGAYVIFFIGADSLFRKWDIENYIKVIKEIQSTYNIEIVVCGGNHELEESILLQKQCSPKVNNLVGQTSLIDLLFLINNCSYVISNETGAVHIACALNKPVLVVSNGNHFGRFVPYPEQYHYDYEAMFPFVANKSNYNEYIKNYFEASHLDINLISSNDVINFLNKKFLLKNVVRRLTEKCDDEQKKVDTAFFNRDQIKENFLFSQSFSRIYQNILELKKLNQRYVIYGNSSFGQFLHHMLKNQVIGMVDQSSQIVTNKMDYKKIYSPESLSKIEYDRIIIAVLGREVPIYNFLINELKINPKKLYIFKIIRYRYSSLSL